jgi:general secretion pathway protein J
MKPAALSRRPQAGLTLLELMVAMAIFSLVATAAYTALDRGVAVQDRLQQQRKFWQGLDVAFSTLARDLEQAIDRVPRAPGREWPVAFQGPEAVALEDTLFRFSRGGLTSFREGPVSPYQRVAYRHPEGQLVRATWPRLDAPATLEADEVVLLDDVSEARVRFLDPQANRWVADWPPPQTGIGSGDADEAVTGLPAVVELTLTLEDHGEFRRIFHVGIPD